MNSDDKPIDTSTAGENLAPETITLDSVDSIVRGVMTWHAHHVAVVKHMRDVPPGSEISFDGQKIVMTPENLAIFQAGINVALSELGTLPFVPEMEEEDPTPSTPEDGALHLTDAPDEGNSPD